LNAAGIVVDSVSYTGSSAKRGISLERQANGIWRYSIDASGATPGRQNSISNTLVPEFTGSLYIEGSPFRPRAGESLQIYYRLPESSARVSSSIYDLRGRKMRTLASNTQVDAEGMLTWDGKRENGAFVPRGLYLLHWESQSGSSARVFRKQLTLVVTD
ncbi:MAG: FlgD immunoglobulin-like domain containing protein, partial [Candidatus Cloacimonadaceae bacterium]|nr:FlgD immunoglobulin-like domain containing protein [Candidatus Cloacimonadaceae bacterium]